VRELGNVIQRAVVMSMGDEISPEDLQLQAAGAYPSIKGDASERTAGSSPANDLAASHGSGGQAGLKERERTLILDTLRQLQGNRKETAHRLGLSSRTLRYKLARMRELGLDIPDAAHRGFCHE
jgi:two-component system response regulator FlrC